MDMDIERIRADIKPEAEGLHQALLNLGYDAWQKKKNKLNSYLDMVNWVGKTYGNVVKFAILVGKANQQIENGGFEQYYSNGYAGDEDSDDIYNHEFILEWIVILGLHHTGIGEEAYKVLSKFKITLNDEQYIDECCGECSSGIIEEPCDDCEGLGNIGGDDCGNCNGSGIVEEDCSYCDASGDIEVDNPDYGSVKSYGVEGDDYFAISEEWMEFLEDYFKKVILL